MRTCLPPSELLTLGQKLIEANAALRAAEQAVERNPSAFLIQGAAAAMRKRDRLLDMWPRRESVDV